METENLGLENLNSKVNILWYVPETDGPGVADTNGGEYGGD